MELRKKEGSAKGAGWSTEKMEEKASNQLVKDTGNVSWRNIHQQEIDDVWKKLSAKT